MYLSIYLCLSLSIYLSVCLFICACLSVDLFISLSVCLSVCMYTCTLTYVHFLTSLSCFYIFAWSLLLCVYRLRNLVKSTLCSPRWTNTIVSLVTEPLDLPKFFINPFTPKSDRLQFSLSVTHERYIIQYGEFGNSWLSNHFSLHNNIIFFLSGWENLHYELGIERVSMLVNWIFISPS